MRLIQFQIPSLGRRVGVVDSGAVIDLTDTKPEWTSVYDIFMNAHRTGNTIEQMLAECFGSMKSRGMNLYDKLLADRPGDDNGWILPPLDHPDPAHCIISGTGLTHLGSTSQRDNMHKADDSNKTDSQKMFEMGLEGGKPDPGVRGVQPEWFYKGNGVILRGHNDFLEVPFFSEDCGEEPEIVGCYIIGDDGVPYRLGFAIANEWSDHAMERVNYLWLAPSKLRTCSVGPELITDQPFKDVRGVCRIYRGEEILYDSGELLTGHERMSHSLANLEDHHFKHPQFRVPGDVHIHFFGTMKLSFGSREPLRNDDKVEIKFEGMGAPLVNYVKHMPVDSDTVIAQKG
jgi:hypothetical protein